MNDQVRGSLTGIDRLFLDALLEEEYGAAKALALIAGARMVRAQKNHALAEGYR